MKQLTSELSCSEWLDKFLGINNAVVGFVALCVGNVISNFCIKNLRSSGIIMDTAERDWWHFNGFRFVCPCPRFFCNSKLVWQNYLKLKLLLIRTTRNSIRPLTEMIYGRDTIRRIMQIRCATSKVHPVRQFFNKVHLNMPKRRVHGCRGLFYASAKRVLSELYSNERGDLSFFLAQSVHYSVTCASGVTRWLGVGAPVVFKQIKLE